MDKLHGSQSRLGATMPRFSALLLAALLALTASAEPPYPEIMTRSAALAALEDPDARIRLAGVVYFGRNGLAADGPLLVKRLSDENPVVRDVAGQAVWLVWGRSGDEETDRLMESGVAEMGAGRYSRAVEFFSKVIGRKPDLAEGWNKRATAWYLAGDMHKSLADCDEVLKRNPQHFGALSGYGLIYLRLEEYGKALEYFRRALAVNPNLASVQDIVRKIEEYLREQRRRGI
ncbi:MAG: tetratricopeptide repeat protein [Betaproteobacteria bacterium]|nr:tetratricopeptide repeat protein [Betaproteobacteria bacterium]